MYYISITTMGVSLAFFMLDRHRWVKDDDFCIDNRTHGLMYYGLPVVFVLAAAGLFWLTCDLAGRQVRRRRRFGLWALVGLAAVEVVILPSMRAGICRWAFNQAIRM
jgi:uncharacterized membrane protein